MFNTMLNKTALIGIVGAAALTFNASATIILSDTFSYPDGVTTNVSGGKWILHSGTGADSFVTNGKLQISQALFQDISSPLRGQPYTPTNTMVTLYASFDVAFSQLPSAAGTYFAHFKDAASNFRARVWASTANAASGSFRLGIANSSGGTGSSGQLATDLSTNNTTYKVVLRYNLNTGYATIWLNPTAETDASVTASDTVNTNVALIAFAFRQTTTEGVMTVDNMIVATTFAEVVGPQPADPPIILTQPLPQTALAGGSAAFSVFAAGSAPLSYQWQRSGTNLIEGGKVAGSTTSNLTLTALSTADQASYSVIVTNLGGLTNSQSAFLTVTNALQAPSIITDPVSQTALAGSTVTFFVVASGTAPLYYQWTFNSTNLPGQTASNLVLGNVRSPNAGPYAVIVSNAVNSVTSQTATLAVTNSPPVSTNIAYLHTLVDANYALTDKTTYYTVRGIVTTHNNLTTGNNALFYMQDGTAGVAVFWVGGGPNLPPAGAYVQVTATNSQYQGLLEMGPNTADTASSVTVLSLGNPLPMPQSLPFDPTLITNAAYMDPLVGSYLVASNVTLDLSSATFVSASAGETITDSLGETQIMYINSYTDIPNQIKPAGTVTILGVLGKYKTSSPYSSGYQFIPSQYADFISPLLPPVVVFTNYLSNLTRPGDLLTNKYSDCALRPGETLRVQTWTYDAEGLMVHIQPLTGTLSPRAQWTMGAASGTNVSATFQFTPTTADASSNYVVVLRAWSSKGTNDQTWNVYVPTPDEQKVYISEFLANPTTSSNLPMFNPLNRALPWTNSNIGLFDQYVEIANLSGTDFDLYGWSISDAVKMRHMFYNGQYGTPPEVLGAGNAVVVYGGPFNGNEPSLSVYAYPASEAPSQQQGLALNRTGTELIVLRNQNGNMVDRVYYYESDLSAAGSLSRFPTLNGSFVPQAYVGANPVSPGKQATGPLFSQAQPSLTNVSPVSIKVSTNRASAQLNYGSTSGRIYTLWQAGEVTGPYKVSNGGVATNAAGQFLDTNSLPANRRFYHITTP